MSKFTMPTFEGVEKGSDEYKEVISVRNKIKKEAMAVLLDFVKENKDAPDDVLEAAECLTPKVRAGQTPGIAKPKKTDIVAELFPKVGTDVDEMEIFNTLKFGRTEMRAITRELIKKAEPANRMWISFDPEQGVYSLEAIGEKAPSNWVGFMPAELSKEEADSLTDID